jgi:hypothetical protein
MIKDKMIKLKIIKGEKVKNVEMPLRNQNLG